MILRTWELSIVGSSGDFKTKLELVDRKDSAVVVAQLEIWPKGKFSFSAEHGFEGEAERVVWHGKTTALYLYATSTADNHKRPKEWVP